MWFDAHLDLAYLDVNRRDMRTSLQELGEMTTGIHPPAAITLEELESAEVCRCLGTIFTEPNGDGPEGYEARDVESAAHVGREQLSTYTRWASQGVVDIATYGRFEEPWLQGAPPLCVGILIENADPIREPDELTWWYEQGVVAIGLSWANDSRYACGNATTDDIGLSDLGKHLVEAMDTLHMVHDVSHLSPQSTSDLFDLASGPMIASHSNCSSLLRGADRIASARHVTDDTIRQIIDRGGVIGLNLFGRFLTPPSENRRATIEDAVAHIEHVCEIAGSTRHVGLGSDMDGGFSAVDLPVNLDRPTKLHALCDALAAKGWTTEDLNRFRWGNWSRVFAGMASKKL